MKNRESRMAIAWRIQTIAEPINEFIKNRYISMVSKMHGR